MVGERKELTPDTKTAVVSLFQSGLRQTEISRRLGIPRTTIAGIINRFRARNSVENLLVSEYLSDEIQGFSWITPLIMQNTA